MGLKVLIADDAAFIHEVLKGHLRVFRPLELRSVYDGESFVQEYENFRPDICFVDLAMPKKNGLQAARAVLARNPDAKIIAISSMAEPALVAEAIAVGCVDYLDKAFQAKEFVSAMEAVLFRMGSNLEVAGG